MPPLPTSDTLLALLSDEKNTRTKHIQIVPTAWLTSIGIGRYLVHDVQHRAVTTRCHTSWVFWIVAGTQSIWPREGVVNIT